VDKEFEIGKELNLYKDEIKNASQRIISKLEKLNDFSEIDKEFVTIFNALGKIGTITGNAHRLNEFSDSVNDLLFDLKLMQGDWGQKSFLIHLLNRICLIGFDVKKRGNKIQVIIPKIEFNFPKIEF